MLATHRLTPKASPKQKSKPMDPEMLFKVVQHDTLNPNHKLASCCHIINNNQYDKCRMI